MSRFQKELEMIGRLGLAAGRSAFALLLATSFVAPNAAAAATATGTMGVSVTVVDSCAVSAIPLVMSTYLSSAASSTGSTALTVTCTIATAVASIGLDFGANALTGVAQLKAPGYAPLIPYALYQDPLYATAWTDAAMPAAYAAIATPALYTVYAKAPGGANVPTGTYNDTVNILVTYV
jgi:spore coat protein U-like protein